MQINFLSNALLSLLLFPLMERTSKSPPPSGHQPTITWVGSMAQELHSFEKYPPQSHEGLLSHFDDPQKFSRLLRYSDTKFLVALFVREMAKHVPHTADGATPVIVNNVCPGTVATEFDKSLPLWFWVPMKLNRIITARSVEEGARALVYAAVVAGRETHGSYIANNRVSKFVQQLLLSYLQAPCLSRREIFS